MEDTKNEKKEYACTHCGSKSENTAGTCCGAERAMTCSQCHAPVKDGEVHTCKVM